MNTNDQPAAHVMTAAQTGLREHYRSLLTEARQLAADIGHDLEGFSALPAKADAVERIASMEPCGYALEQARGFRDLLDGWMQATYRNARLLRAGAEAV